MKTDKDKRTFMNCRFITALAIACVVVVAVSVLHKEVKPVLTLETLTNSANERRQEGDWIWWITRGYLKSGTDCDVAVFGSSQMGAALYSAEAEFRKDAVDTVVVRNSKLIENLLAKDFGFAAKSFNFSFGGAMISDQYLLASSLFNEQHKPKLVIIGVNPRDFIDNSLASPSATDPYRLLARYADLKGLEFASFSNPLEWMDWKMNNSLPIRLEGRAMVKDVTAVVSNLVRHTNKDSSTLQVTGEGETENSEEKAAAETEKGDALKALYQTGGHVKPGQWRVVATSWGAFKDNTREYQVRYKNPSPAIYPQERQFFEHLLAHLQSQNIKTLVVGMPSLWPNRALLSDQFWSDFRSYVASTCAGYDADWVDFTDDKRFSSNDYLDTVHLNSTGGTKLMKAIAESARPMVAELNRPNSRYSKTRAVAGTGSDL